MQAQKKGQKNGKSEWEIGHSTIIIYIYIYLFIYSLVRSVTLAYYIYIILCNSLRCDFLHIFYCNR